MNRLVLTIYARRLYTQDYPRYTGIIFFHSKQFKTFEHPARQQRNRHSTAATLSIFHMLQAYQTNIWNAVSRGRNQLRLICTWIYLAIHMACYQLLEITKSLNEFGHICWAQTIPDEDARSIPAGRYSEKRRKRNRMKEKGEEGETTHAGWILATGLYWSAYFVDFSKTTYWTMGCTGPDWWRHIVLLVGSRGTPLHYLHILQQQHNPRHFWLYAGQAIYLQNQFQNHGDPDYCKAHPCLHIFGIMKQA